MTGIPLLLCGWLLLVCSLLRVAVVLYEAFQPVECAPGQQVTASTSKRQVNPPGTTAAAGVAGARQMPSPSVCRCAC